MIYSYFYIGNIDKNNQHEIAYKLLFDKIREIYDINASFNDVKIGKFGKPYFENIDLNFNVSHTKNAVLAAFCEKNYSNLGADTEKIRKYRKNKFLTDAENALSENNDELYTRLLSLKESYGKFTGIGLADFSKIYFDKNLVSNKSELDFYSDTVNNYVISLCFEKNKKFLLTKLN